MLTGEFPDCEIKLCDLEISRVITAGTEVREMLGTPDYVGKYDRMKLTPLFIPPPSRRSLARVHPLVSPDLFPTMPE